MEVHFSPDVETQLQQVASADGKDAEQLLKEKVARMLESQARFTAGVQRASIKPIGASLSNIKTCLTVSVGL